MVPSRVNSTTASEFSNALRVFLLDAPPLVAFDNRDLRLVNCESKDNVLCGRKFRIAVNYIWQKGFRKTKSEEPYNSEL